MTAWWQHPVSKSGTVSLSQNQRSLEAGGQGSGSGPYPWWQHAVPSQEHCYTVGWATERASTL